MHKKKKRVTITIYSLYVTTGILKTFLRLLNSISTVSPMNCQCLDGFHVRARTRGVAALTAHHPFSMRLGFWLAITPIIMLPMRRRTKSSRTTWMARSRAGARKERWLPGSPAAGNPPFVICLYDHPPPPPSSSGVDFFCRSFPTIAHFPTIFFNHRRGAFIVQF